MPAPIIRVIDVPCSPDRAFAIFADMGSWWPLEKRSMSLYTAKAPAKSLTVEPRVGGQIVETGADDARHHWGTFTAFAPPTHLQLDFHMGLPATKSGRVDVTFTATGANATRVQLTHSHWEGYEDMADMMFNGYNSSWPMLFDDAYAAACQQSET